jgi:hypothetical protein
VSIDPLISSSPFDGKRPQSILIMNKPKQDQIKHRIEKIFEADVGFNGVTLESFLFLRSVTRSIDIVNVLLHGFLK